MRAAIYLGLGLALLLVVAPTTAWAASLEGRWNSNLGVATFTQDGSSIKGELVLANGQKAEIAGVLMEKELYFSYVHENGALGTGKLVLSENEQQLRGTFKDAAGAEREWILARASEQPAVADISGRWNSNLGSVAFEQEGANVTGTLTFANGQTAAISGQVAENRFSFSFRHSNGQQGTGQVTLASNGHQMAGSYRDQMGRSHEWTLTRPSQEAPNIAGRWNSNLGSVMFEQHDRDVNGTLTFANGQTASIQGRLSGGNLDFAFRHVNGSTGTGRVGLASDQQRMSGSYVDNRTGHRAMWVLSR
jgi:hypothetical protein